MRRKIIFAKLFNIYDTYNNEMLFEIFRWMIRTGWEYRQDGNGVFELLFGHPTCLNSQMFHENHGFSGYNYINEMTLIWVRAILSDDISSTVKKWREDNDINFKGVRYIDLQVANKSINPQLFTLFESHKKELTKQLNEHHPGAIAIDGVLLTVNHKEWKAILNYGGGWHYTLAKQGEKPFADFLDEACSELARLTA